MNRSEQKNHKTAVAELAKSTERCIDSIELSLTRLDDAEDRLLRERIYALQAVVFHRGFWSRLKWLFFGR